MHLIDNGIYMSDFKTNKTLNDFLHIGPDTLRTFKKIILNTTYADFGESLSLETAQEAIHAYAKMGGSTFHILELIDKLSLLML